MTSAALEAPRKWFDMSRLRTGLIAGLPQRRRWSTSFVLTVAIAAGCERNEQVTIAPGSAATIESPTDGLEWIASARQLYDSNHGRRTEHGHDAIARLRFTKPSLPDGWRQHYCTAPCSDPTLFVRVRVESNAVTFHPFCNTQEPELALLEEWQARGPWKPVQGDFRSNSAFVLRSASGEHVAGRVEFMTPPSTETERVWDDWLYSRALAVAHAQSVGIGATLLGKATCRNPHNLPLCEAELATEASPLALLRSLGPCPLSYMSEQECNRYRVGLPVQTGHFNNFCGRVDIDPLEDPLSQEERGKLIRRRAQLEAAGVDVTRLLLGAAWTAYWHYIPQVSIDQLALVSRAVGLGEVLAKRVSELRDANDVSWPNRFRAAVLGAMLMGPSPDDATLRQMFAQYTNACSGSGGTAACAQNIQSLRDTDSCIDVLLGRGSFGCMFG